MPTPTSFLSSSPHNQPSYPALYLYPLNESFVPKHIVLSHNQRVKVGRQTNAKTSPAERNGYFDSKVLSRQHAEVWEEGGKIYIKDVKSSNGTFINGERLSAEGIESDPYELKSDDIVEFGIDIVGEDNKTIVHHKVSARVICVFNEQDAQAAARAEQNQSSSSMGIASQASGSGSSSVNFFSMAGPQGQPSSSQRRPPLQPQGLGGMGGMGGSMRAPGKSGLTFDHILSRLQGELQKSRETGAELHSLTGTMTDIHDTLGGSLPQNLPAYPQVLPPVRSQQQQQQQLDSASSDLSTAPPLSALSELQTQLHDTQSSLANHVDKIRALEGMLAEQEAIKREVSSLREMMEERKREMDDEPHQQRREYRDSHDRQERQFDRDDDDAASIRTIVPHELERVEEEDEDQVAAEEDEEDRRRRREELGRPRTPEPTGMGMHEDDDEPRRDRNHLLSAHHPSSPPPAADRQSASIEELTRRLTTVDELTERLSTLSGQLESALQLSSSLQAQHTAAQSTINALELKVSALESLVQSTNAQVQAQQAAQEEARSQAIEAARIPAEEHERERESLTKMLNEWKKSVEGQWTSVQEEWNAERERLSKAKEEWETRVKAIEAGVGNIAVKVDSFRHQQTPLHMSNGDAKINGLVTPPSPRSISADSNGPRRRKRRANSSRGRSRSNSPVDTDITAVDEPVEHSKNIFPRPTVSPTSRPFSPTMPDDSSDSEHSSKSTKASQYLATPDSSIHQPLSARSASGSASNSNYDTTPIQDMHFTQVSAAVGVLVLSVAAAAVIWRVKPE